MSLIDNLSSVFTSFLRMRDYILWFCPYLQLFYGRRILLSYKAYRSFDKRMHISVIFDERNDLAVLCKDLLDLP